MNLVSLSNLLARRVAKGDHVGGGQANHDLVSHYNGLHHAKTEVVTEDKVQ